MGTCAEVIKHVAHIIHKVHDEKDKEFELEMSWLCPQSNNEQAFVPKELMKEAEEYAKALWLPRRKRTEAARESFLSECLEAKSLFSKSPLPICLFLQQYLRGVCRSG